MEGNRQSNSPEGAKRGSSDGEETAPSKKRKSNKESKSSKLDNLTLEEMEEMEERRQIANREAVQRFRTRQKTIIKTQGEAIAELRYDKKNLQASNDALRKEIDKAQQRLAELKRTLDDVLPGERSLPLEHRVGQQDPYLHGGIPRRASLPLPPPERLPKSPLYGATTELSEIELRAADRNRLPLPHHIGQHDPYLHGGIPGRASLHLDPAIRLSNPPLYGGYGHEVIARRQSAAEMSGLDRLAVASSLSSRYDDRGLLYHQ